MSFRLHRIPLLNVGDEFLQEEIAVTSFTICRIDKEGSPPLGRRDKEVADPVLLPQVLNYIPAAAVEERLLVVAYSVEEIQHRIAARRVLGRIALGEKHAITH